MFSLINNYKASIHVATTQIHFKLSALQKPTCLHPESLISFINSICGTNPLVLLFRFTI